MQIPRGRMYQYQNKREGNRKRNLNKNKNITEFKTEVKDLKVNMHYSVCYTCLQENEIKLHKADYMEIVNKYCYY